MRILITLLAISTALSVQSQTSRHMIAGTRLTIEVPEGTVVGKHAPIVHFDNRIDLNIIEFNDKGSLKKFQDEVDSAGFVKGGYKVVKTFSFPVDHTQGKFFILESGRNNYGLTGYFGDSTFAANVSAEYPRTDSDMQSILIQAIKSIGINDKENIDWNSFLTFTYDPDNTFKLDAGQNHNLGIHFTPNGDSETKVFKTTNVMCLQFPPTQGIYSAQDIITNVLISQITSLEITEVLFDGLSEKDNPNKYCFNVKCKRNDQEFELFCVAQYHETSCLLSSAYIIDGGLRQEVKDFVNGFILKKDGY